ncbi:type IX secretion system membrane protein, PorP/SprF family [Mariniphaga anaerophila]|uniref:Type IX secretion system membrane protein, PorP/SprF family n=1 Tax=Mariniphaga anaerophila TaxID=1484053 RepID=A0A1M5FS65_9BACT|nr:type IX secretion system membrane protein PorP/SprF [Mariniphaga anaerophila]SHF94338.1 type IX secretion system membrane protein, PorP/SprF family [Mariniphaga anaerophila]
MKKIFSFLYLLLIIKLVAWGQIDPQFTNNMHYKLGVNPGYAGAENAINGLILNRYQWEGMPGAPKTLVFSADAAINTFGAPGGVGLNFVRDQLGFAKNILINANYAYRADLGFGKLGIGVSFGVYSQSINGEWKIPEDSYGIYTPPNSDTGIPQGESSQAVFDVGSGLYLSSNRYYLGVSVTHINQATIEYDETARSYLTRHYYLSGGYNIKLSDPLFELRPSFLFKTDAASWQLDMNANIVYDDRFWGGLSYRVDDAVALLMGLELANGLKVGYSFDLVTSAIGYYGFASHEIFIGYSINLERNRNQKYKSIRFL